MEYSLMKNRLTAEDFINLRFATGWYAPKREQAEKAIANSLFNVVALHNNKVIGAGRLVGDTYTICYIQDVMVLPEYQGVGVGTAITERLIKHIKENALPGTDVTIGLFSAQGKESFYERLGFKTRPYDNRGAGMEMVVKNELITKG